MTEQRKTRTAFCKDDQDQLAAFLATHPGPRSGAALYQEFGLINNSHTWQSWRNHYLKNSEMIDTIIRRIQKRKKEDCAKTGDRITSDQKQKGKARAPAVEVIEIDAGNESPCENRPKNRPASGAAEDFTLIRVQNDKRLKSVGLQNALPGNSSSSTSSKEAWSSNRDGSDLSAKDPGITMTSDEEQHFFEFLSQHPAGDIRLSMNLYEKYHRRATRWSPRQYHAYYLAHRQRLDGSSPLHLRSHDINLEVAKQNCGTSPRSNGAPNGVASPAGDRPTVLETELPDADPMVGPEIFLPTTSFDSGQPAGHEALPANASRVVGPEVSKEDRFPGIDTLSVSMGSPDDLNSKYLTTSSSNLKLNKASSIPADSMGSHSKVQDNQVHHSDCETSTEEDEGDLRLLRRIQGQQNVIQSLEQRGHSDLNPVGIRSRDQVKKARVEDRLRERGDKIDVKMQICNHLNQNSAENQTPGPFDENRAEAQTRGQPNEIAAEIQSSDQLNQDGAGKEICDQQNPNAVVHQSLSHPGQTQAHHPNGDHTEQNTCPNILQGSEISRNFPSALTSGVASPPRAPGKSPLKSGMTSRTNSFKPANDPTSLDEAIALVSEFLEDFGDLYSAREALALFHHCGNWTLMFEVATLRRMELEGEEVDHAYAAMVKALVWTDEEDHLILEFEGISSTPSELFAEMGAKMRALESKKGLQAIDNRKEFLNGFLDS